MKIMASGPITSWQIDGETVEIMVGFIFLGSKITVDYDCSHKLKDSFSLKEAMTILDSILEKQRHHFANNHPYSQNNGFSSGHVWMWELNHKEGLSPEELMLSNCGAEDDSWESLGLQGGQTSHS